MTTFVDFNPQPNVAFQFTATFDQNQYVVIVTWNVFGQRYYINVFDLLGTLVVSTAMVGSPLNYDINLVAGHFFISTLVWRVETGQFEIGP